MLAIRNGKTLPSFLRTRINYLNKFHLKTFIPSRLFTNHQEYDIQNSNIDKEYSNNDRKKPWYQDYPGTSDPFMPEDEPMFTSNAAERIRNSNNPNLFPLDSLPDYAPELLRNVSKYILDETILRDPCAIHLKETRSWNNWIILSNIRGGRDYKVDGPWQGRKHRGFGESSSIKVDKSAGKRIIKATKDISRYLKSVGCSGVEVSGIFPPGRYYNGNLQIDWGIVNTQEDEIVIHILTEGKREWSKFEEFMGCKSSEWKDDGLISEEWLNYNRKNHPADI